MADNVRRRTSCAHRPSFSHCAVHHAEPQQLPAVTHGSMHAHSTKAHGTDAVSCLSLPRVDACTLSKCGASPLGGHKLVPLDAGFIAAIDCNLGHAPCMKRNDDSAPKSTILAEEQRIYGGFGKIAN